MRVICVFDGEKSQVSLMGRTDPPDSGDFLITIRPGESYRGLTYDQLAQLASFETDPISGNVVSTSPASQRVALTIPDWLRKAPAK